MYTYLPIHYFFRLKNLMTQDKYRVPCDYTRYFKKKGTPVPVDEREADISSLGGYFVFYTEVYTVHCTQYIVHGVVYTVQCAL